MHRGLRLAALVGGIALIAVGLGFAFGSGWATELWPWPDGRLSYQFVGAVAAAAGAHLLWIAAANEPAMFQAFAIDSLVLSLAGAIHTWRIDGRSGVGDLGLTPFVYVAATVLSVGLLLWSWRRRPRDSSETPRLVRVSYAGFVVALLLVSLGLITTQAHIFPWPLKPETSVFFGWTLVGSAAYYGFGALRREWIHAGPQLLAFLVYDLVLLVPFLRHLDAVAEEHRLSLAIYLGVIVYSGLLAAYFLSVHPATRFWKARRREDASPQPSLTD